MNIMIIIMVMVILVVLMAVPLTQMLTVVLSGQVLSSRIRIGIDGQAAPLHITRMFPAPLTSFAPTYMALSVSTS
jgi:hypothetical protein